MVWIILIASCLGMVIPTLLFPVAEKACKNKWQIFAFCGGIGVFMAFMISYTAYLQFFK